MNDLLLDRNGFRNAVFQRDGHKCVECKEPAVDAHHLIERRLWSDGGYYLSNGVSLCSKHHLDAEKTLLSVEELRAKAGIDSVLVPPHLSQDGSIDKWGNPIVGEWRLKGELFDDASVQKILAAGDVLRLFQDYVKYPRTPHVPGSPGSSPDDRHQPDLSALYGTEVIVTEKMDGENATLYTNYYHARSTTQKYHGSRDWIGALQGRIGWEIPERWRICGENMYAKHSIHYNELESYFLVHSVWNEHNMCLSWGETLEWCDLLGIQPVPLLDRFIFDEKEGPEILDRIRDGLDLSKQEGYVIRPYKEFHYSEFTRLVAKWVRPNHIETDADFLRQKIVPNQLKHSPSDLK